MQMSEWPSSNETVINFDNTILIPGRVPIITILLNNILQSSIQEVPGANLSLRPTILTKVSRGISSFLQPNITVITKTSHNTFLCNSWFTNHPNIQWYILL